MVMACAHMGAQTSITLTTTKTAGETFSFTVNAGITCTVNWGGVTPETIVSTGEPITGTLVRGEVNVKAFGLTYLNASGQSLTKISMTDPDDLETLLLSDNQLSAINVTKATNLRTLWCDNNEITALGLSKCPLLECVLCSGNKITRITYPTEGFDAMADFWANENELTTLNLLGGTRIKTLNVENNALKTMTLSPLEEKAVAVFLDGNNLDFTSFWNTANVGAYYIGNQGTLALAKAEYNIGEEITTRDLYGVNADSVSVGPTYAWYAYDTEGTAKKLTRGSGGDFVYKSTTEKHIFKFNKAFDDVNLEITSSKYRGVTLQTDHIRIIDPTGVECMEGSDGSDGSDGLELSAEEGYLTLTATQPTTVAIYDLGGVLRWQGTVQGSERIQLGHGTFVINHVKVSM